MQANDMRPLAPRDLPAIMRVQRASYRPSLIEPPEAFLSKISSFPMGAWGHLSDGELAAYIVCVPGTSNDIYPLGSVTASLPDRPDHLYIHDLAVHPAHRGHGIADRLIHQAEAVAAELGHRRIALTSVQGSEQFWVCHGFEHVRWLEYAPGEPAAYMVKTSEL